MAYIKGNRNQMMLLPQVVEDFIAKDDPVRAYDAFVEALDYNALGLAIEERQPGANPYWPKTMLKLLIYGYAYGIRSSRKLERACYHNLAFIWLTEDVKPDHRTIARFRIAHKDILKKVLHQCARMCIELGLIEGNTLFVDGTKIKANASIQNTWSGERLQKHDSKISENIEHILAECEAIDNAETDKGSLVKLQKELADQKTLRAKIGEINKKLKESKRQKLNTTDAESFVFKADRGTKMYHNAQMTVDEKHGLIVSTDVINQSVDTSQLSIQSKEAQEVLDRKAENICADHGYYSLDDIERIDAEINIIVPSKEQLKKERTPERVKLFSKAVFKYDDKHDCYMCPERKKLQRTNDTIPDRPNAIIYQAHSYDCRHCKHFGACTTLVKGRRIVRQKNETLMRRLSELYDSDVGQRIYKLRKQKVELPFAHFKHHMNLRQLLLRGTGKVGIELNLCAIGYNLTRMIGLLGISGLKEAIMVT